MRFHWTRASVLRNPAEALQSVKGTLRNLVVFGQVPKSTKHVCTPCEVCFVIHTFIFSLELARRISERSLQERTSKKPCRSQNMCETGRHYDIFLCYFRPFCTYAIILVLSGLYMWIQQRVQHLQWFNKELTACTLTGSCHSRHSREQSSLHSIFTISNHEWAGKKSNATIQWQDWPWIKRNMGTYNSPTCLKSALFNPSSYCILTLR